MSVAAVAGTSLSSWPVPRFRTANRRHPRASLRTVRVLAIAAATVLLGVGAVWVGKHAPVPSNRPSASELARDRQLELAYRSLQVRLGIRERRARALARARNRWAHRANRICGSVARADWAALRRINRAHSTVEILNILASAEVAERRVLDELEALPRPPGRAGARVRRMLGLYEKAYALDREAFAAIRGGDHPRLFRIVEQELPLVERADEIARDLNANVCADGVFADR
jgi:hypothetical protein